MAKSTIRVAVTGGAGQIAYNLLFRIASGEMLGLQQRVALHILELPEALKALEGVKMELEDCAFPLLAEIIIGSDPKIIFKDIHYALLVGAKPRGPGMERKDLLNDNGKIFVEQGKALDQVADRNVKVLVVGNPCNTNCLIAMHNAPHLPRENFHAMVRLDQNRAVAQLAQKANVGVSDIANVVIWGNHSSTQVPDVYHATILGQPATKKINDKTWIEGDFISTVQKRGAAIIAARGKSSAASAANAVIDSIRALNTPTPKGQWFCSSVYSDGTAYDIAKDIFFSVPCRSKGDGKYEIIKGVTWNPFLIDKIRATEKELMEERELVLKLIPTKARN